MTLPAPSGTLSLIRFLEHASQEGGIVRWEGLRKLGAGFAGQDILIPLDNDGNLIQQFRGLEKWSHHFAHDFGFSREEASLVALAYVARQLQGENFLLNNQTDATRSTEAEKLMLLAEKVLTGQENNEAAAVFNRTARHLKNSQDEADIGNLLREANAAFYIETGVSACTWTDNMKDWLAKVQNNQDAAGLVQLQNEAVLAARLLAANAYGNNAKKLTGRLNVEELLAPLDAHEYEFITSDYTYRLSLGKAKAATPSRDRITTQLPAVLPSEKAPKPAPERN